MTHADISLTTKVLGYQPKTHVKEGTLYCLSTSISYSLDKMLRIVT